MGNIPPISHDPSTSGLARHVLLVVIAGGLLNHRLTFTLFCWLKQVTWKSLKSRRGEQGNNLPFQWERLQRPITKDMNIEIELEPIMPSTTLFYWS